MPDVRVNIDGAEIMVPSGSTVLEAAKLAGVDIPTLCDHPALEPIGACRICLVEIEKQRVLQPACTFPVFEGMVVHSRSDKVVGARQFVLQLLFSERNHFCMFCQMSGSCELQNLAYDYQLDHWQFQRPMPTYGVDASRVYFAMDHNRCILCRRCIRACDELVGNGTLGLKNRGAHTVVVADLDVPFGLSSCISCGTCLQVCPTGALMDRASAYLGATAEVQRIKSRCMACPVGCGTELVVRENRVIRVEGDWEAEPNDGLLCVRGRFEPLHEDRNRVRQPLVQKDGAWAVADAADAYALVAARLSEAGDDVATVASGFVTVEEGRALLDTLPGNHWLMHPVPPLERTATVNELDLADMFIVPNTDLDDDFNVAGIAIKRGVRQRGAHLILVGDSGEEFRDWAMREFGQGELDQVATLASGADFPVIVAGPEGLDLACSLAVRMTNARVLPWAPGGNTRGLYEAGFGAQYAGQAAAVTLVVAGETNQIDAGMLSALDAQPFVVVMASYREPWDGVADIILPMPTMFEKNGTTVNADGAVGRVVAAVNTRVPQAQETIGQLVAAVR